MKIERLEGGSGEMELDAWCMIMKWTQRAGLGAFRPNLKNFYENLTLLVRA